MSGEPTELYLPPLAVWALTLARAAAAVANFCDHAEHNEITDKAWVLGAGREMVEVALEFAAAEGLSLQTLYAQRLRNIESHNLRYTSDSLDGGELVERASTWRELQNAQTEHDLYYHPDVIGLSKAEQLRHYALHVAKLAGAAAEVAEGKLDISDFEARRLPDLLLFAIKLSTVCGQVLPESALPNDENSSPWAHHSE